MDNSSESTQVAPPSAHLNLSKLESDDQNSLEPAYGGPSARSLEIRRVLQYTSGNFAGSMIGPVFIFGIFAYPLGTLFHFDNSQLNVMTSTAYIFSYCAIFSGIMLDYMGPRIVNAVGFAIASTGWLLMAIFFYLAGEHPGTGLAAPTEEGKAQKRTVALFTLAFCACASLGGVIDCGLMIPTLTAYNRNQGETILVQKTLMGLGSALVGLWYSGFFESRTDGKTMSSFIFMIAGLTAFFGALAALLHRAHDTRRDPQKPHSRFFFNVPMPKTILIFSVAILLALTAYILATTIVLGVMDMNGYPLGSAWDSAIGGIASLIFMGFWLMPLLAWLTTPSNKTAVEVAERYETSVSEEPEEAAIQDHTGPTGARLFKSLRDLNFYLLGFAIFVGFGGLTALISNTLNLYAATLDNCNKVNSETNAMLSTLDGAGSALGRIFAGCLLRFFRQSSPTAFLSMTMFLEALGAGVYLLCFLKSNLIYLFVIIHGFALGCLWSYVPLIAHTLYKGASVGLHFGVLMFFAMAATPIMQMGVVVPTYNAAGLNKDGCCLGFNCYGISATVIVALSLLSGLLSIWLHVRVIRHNRKHTETSEGEKGKVEDLCDK